MKHPSLTFHALIASACMAMVSLPAGAQDAQKQAPAASVQGTQMRQHAHQRMTPERWQQARAERAAAFKNKLALTSEQETAWSQLQQALQPSAHARIDRQEMAGLSTPERIDRMRAERLQRAAQADKRGDAIKTFYAVLTPEQQKMFDAQRPGMGRHSMGAGHRSGHGHFGKHHGMHRQGASAASAPAA